MPISNKTVKHYVPSAARTVATLACARLGVCECDITQRGKDDYAERMYVRKCDEYREMLVIRGKERGMRDQRKKRGRENTGVSMLVSE